MFRITEDPSSGSIVQCLVENFKNYSIVSIDMDKVGVMTAYSDPLWLCVVHCIWKYWVPSYTISSITKCLIIIDARCKHEESNMVLRPSGQVVVEMGMMS